MSSKVSREVPCGWGRSDAFTLHPVLNHQMARYYLCASVPFLLLPPRPSCLGMFHPLLPGDGWLQLSTNNHSRSIWLHSLCLGWGNTTARWKWSCFNAGFFVFCCLNKNRKSSEQIHLITFSSRVTWKDIRFLLVRFGATWLL